MDGVQIHGSKLVDGVVVVDAEFDGVREERSIVNASIIYQTKASTATPERFAKWLSWLWLRAAEQSDFAKDR